MMIVLYLSNWSAAWVSSFFGVSTSQGIVGTAICYGILAIIVLKLIDFLGAKRMRGDMG